MPDHQSVTRARLRTVLLLGLSLLIATGVPAFPAAASPPPRPSVHKYIGTWNYDQPERSTMRNIAVISCPDSGNGCASSQYPLPLHVPQIGNLVFTAAGGGRVIGRTDQGCTWRFAATTRSLELSPPGQYCFNRTIGSGYTLNRWSVTVAGRHEREVINGVSHQPTGDLVFAMDYGSRTKVAGVGGFRAMARYAGAWTYDPASARTLVNLLVTQPIDAGGIPAIEPVHGVVRITAIRYGTIAAHTPDGCRWTLAVRGNTAQLDPGTQTCHGVTLTFWSAASDGERLNTVVAGTKDMNGQKSNIYLFIGALTKQ